MNHAILVLVAAAHKAEHFAGIYHAAGEDAAAAVQREVIEDCRHGIEILGKLQADWMDEFGTAAKEQGLAHTVTEDLMAELYRDGLTPAEAVAAILEDLAKPPA